MNKERDEMLQRLKNVKSMEEYNLGMLGKLDDIEIDDVKYLGKVEVIHKTNGKKESETINVYAVIEGKTIKYYSDDMPLAAETKGIGKNKEEVVPSLEYERMFEKDNPIKDIIENLKQKEIEEQEKSRDERTVVSLKDLEEKKSKSETKEESKDKEKDEKIIPEFRTDKSGSTSLDQMIDGVTLRNVLGLSSEYECIKPVSASKLRGYADVENHDAVVAIKRNGECTVLDESIIRPDRQEGKNSSNQDLNINNDGSVEYKSNTSSYQIVNSPNYYVAIGNDEGSTRKAIKLSKRSGREGDQEVEFELHKYGAAEYEESDARNLRQSNEIGIEKSETIENRQKEYERMGSQNESVENIKNDNMDICVNPEQNIPGTDVTWQEFANRCGYRGKDGVDRAYKEFKDYEADHKDLKNEEIIENVIEEKENEIHGPNRRR